MKMSLFLTMKSPTLLFALLCLTPFAQSQVLIGEPCDDNLECYGFPYAFCQNAPVNGFCQCNDGFVPRIDLMGCLPIVDDIDGACSQNSQCTQGLLGGLSTCENFLSCVCVSTAVHVASAPTDQCRLKATLIEDDCIAPEQCEPNLGDNAFCDADFKCRCNPTESMDSPDRTKCLPKVDTIGGHCEQSGQCRLGRPGPHSMCAVNRTCVCVTTAIPVGDVCYPKAGLDQPCSADEQCVADNSECSPSDRCWCNPATTVESSDGLRCLTLAQRIGESCEETSQCLRGMPGDYSTCSRDPIGGTSTCQCTEEAVVIPGNQKCQKKATHVGDSCLIHDQCRINLGSLSFCDDAGKCACSPGSTESSDGTRCLVKDGLIGSACEDTVQCVDTAVCTATGQCSCPNDSVASRDLSRCLSVIHDLNQVCEEPQQCQQGTPGIWSGCLEKYVGGSTQRVCSCTTESIAGPGSNVCLKKATVVGDPCQIMDQCLLTLGRSQCVGGTCQCYSDSSPSANRTKCVPKSSLTQPCEDPGQCSHIPPLGSASCWPIDPQNPGGGSVCACNPGFGPAPEGQEACIRFAGLIGDPCGTDGSQCAGLPGAVCDVVTKTCLCDPSRDMVVHPDRTKCLLRAHNLNSICEHTIQCVPSASECIIGSGAVEGRCVCRPGQFIESVANPGNCVELRNELNSTCAEDVQCSSLIGGLAECKYGFCRCGERHGEYNGRCYFRSVLGGQCFEDAECFAGISPYTICSLSKCHCKAGAVEYASSCWENKWLGDPCTLSEECRVTIRGDVTCDPTSLMCACLWPTTPDVDQKTCSGQERIGGVALINLVLVLLISVFMS